jgi:hypothetical protein
MLIPRGTSFLIRCKVHEATLEGELKMKHPNNEATAIWTFDFTDMHCPSSHSAPVGKACQTNWEVRA